MNKKNKVLSFYTILSLLLCIFAAVVIWLIAKYNSTPDLPAAMAAAELVNSIF